MGWFLFGVVVFCVLVWLDCCFDGLFWCIGVDYVVALYLRCLVYVFATCCFCFVSYIDVLLWVLVLIGGSSLFTSLYLLLIVLLGARVGFTLVNCMFIGCAGLCV